MAVLWDVDIAQLEERGYFILRGFVPPETCAAARAFVDGVIGAPSPVEQMETEGRGQPMGATVQQPQGFTSTNWPDPSSELPYLTSGNYRHGLVYRVRSKVLYRTDNCDLVKGLRQQAEEQLAASASVGAPAPV